MRRKPVGRDAAVLATAAL